MLVASRNIQIEHIVTKMWKQAVMPPMDVGDPSNNGWLPGGRIDWIDIPEGEKELRKKVPRKNELRN